MRPEPIMAVTVELPQVVNTPLKIVEAVGGSFVIVF